MRTVPAAYWPPTLTFGRFQSLNDKVMCPEATLGRNSGLNCIDQTLRPGTVDFSLPNGTVIEEIVYAGPLPSPSISR